MKKAVEGSGANRRGFLQRAAGSIAGAALVTILPAGQANGADAKPCSAEEVEQLKKRVHDSQFNSATATGHYVQKLQEKFGTGVIDVVKKTTIENAKQQTEKNPLPKGKRNLQAVRDFYAGIGEDVTYTWAENRPEKLKANVTRCRWAEEFKKAGIPGEIGFALVCSYDYGFCAGLNPEMKFTRTKTIMQGDDHCDHTYELKA